MRLMLLVPVSILWYLTSCATESLAKCADGHFGDQCRQQCRCLNNTECDDVTGICPSGCYPGWSGRACQMENTAYGRSATIKASGRYNDVGNITTDGDVSTCVSTRPNRTGMWTVNLGVSQRAYSMRIRTGNTSFRSWRVYVSQYEEMFWTTPCTTLRYDGTDMYFVCDIPVTGRYVGLMNPGRSVSVCELEIFACADYTYGVESCSRCRCSDRLEVCDNVYGTCKSGCQEGWTGPSCEQGCNNTYGKNCIHRCGHCDQGSACDVVNGTCTKGCDLGWTGTMCTQQCSEGWYGRNCNLQCAHCADGTTCSVENGTCAKGCAVGWKGPRCNIECDFGEYGKNCALQCGYCKNQTWCDRMTGWCPSGCDAGWEGIFCNQECLPGKYGEDCLLSCEKCRTQPCDRHNGSCGVDGCLQGWSGDICDFACAPGFYGTNCLQVCGHCDNNVICDPLNGSCGTPCTSGYHGDKCIMTCPGGSWGDNCSNVCGLCHRNVDCNHVTGLCDKGCFVGYYGKYCEFALEFKDLSSAIVMPVMAVSVCIVAFNLCLLFVCLVFKWRRDEKDIPHATGGKSDPLLPAPESSVSS